MTNVVSVASAQYQWAVSVPAATAQPSDISLCFPAGLRVPQGLPRGLSLDREVTNTGLGSLLYQGLYTVNCTLYC